MPLSDLIPQFYASATGNYRLTFDPGQLYWAPTFYLPPLPTSSSKSIPTPPSRV